MPTGLFMMRWLYTVILLLLTPALLLRLWWRGRVHPGYRQGWSQRFGFVPRRPPGGIWVHAVSVGEVLAAIPVIRAQQASEPGVIITVSTTTPTGADRVRAAFADADPQRFVQVYAPFDFPWAWRLFLQRVQPRQCWVMETELWPNLLQVSAQRQLPVWLLNARMSKRSARGYARVASLTRPMLQQLTGVCAQAPADLRRLRVLGVPATRLHLTGSVKTDVQISAAQRQEASALRAQLGVARPVLIAASTHEGEEAIVLDAFARWRQQRADAALILVPRHPDRFERVADLLATRGWRVTRRSRGFPDAETDVFLGDSMGELLMLYCAADLAFVGGSLVPTGGHNLLEPAAVPLPILQGPHTHNFHALTRLFRKRSAVRIVGNAAELATQCEQTWAERQVLSERAATVLADLRGSLDRVMARLG